MDLERVREVVADTPHMTLRQANVVASLVQENDISDVLELGFYRGVSTAYVAAILDDLGRGHVTAIDLDAVADFDPGLESFLATLGLTDRVSVIYEPTSYVWRMMKMLDEDPEPRFDLVYLDGAHDWFADGFAFFLADRLLRPGGWMIFDDVDWTFGSSPGMRDSERVRTMPSDERDTAQVRKIVELLVAPHPSYGDITIKNDWAVVQKHRDASHATATTITNKRGVKDLAPILGAVSGARARLAGRKS